MWCVCVLYTKQSVLAKSDMHLDACAVKPIADVEEKCLIAYGKEK